MTVEEIYKDRKKFSAAVFEVASTDLVNMGISIISYTIKDITDEVGYLAVSLHMSRISFRRTNDVLKEYFEPCRWFPCKFAFSISWLQFAVCNSDGEMKVGSWFVSPGADMSNFLHAPGRHNNKVVLIYHQLKLQVIQYEKAELISGW